jgi:hypothetical protein
MPPLGESVYCVRAVFAAPRTSNGDYWRPMHPPRCPGAILTGRRYCDSVRASAVDRAGQALTIDDVLGSVEFGVAVNECGGQQLFAYS